MKKNIKYDIETAQKEADKAQEEADRAEDEAKKAEIVAKIEKDPIKKKELEQVAIDKKKIAEEKHRETISRDNKLKIVKKISQEKPQKKERSKKTIDKTIKEKNYSFIEPFKAYKYKVLFVPVWNYLSKNKSKRDEILNSKDVLGFNSVSDISNTTEEEPYNEGGENSYKYTFPKSTSAGEVTFSHGATSKSTIGRIRNIISGTKEEYYNAQFSILVIMYHKTEPTVWILKNVWPKEIKLSGFSTENSGNIIIESLTVSVQKAELETILEKNETNSS